MPVSGPQMVIVISGKRKSGKDYFANLLNQEVFAGTSAIIRLSAPLKKAYADMHDLDYDRLLDSSAYKETYRKDMIKWGEEQREKDTGVFCKLATETIEKPVWIVSDARRPSDLHYFRTKYGKRTVLVRIECCDSVRVERGWCFAKGVDDVDSECALDSFADWDYKVCNEGGGSLQVIASELKQKLSNFLQDET